MPSNSSRSPSQIVIDIEKTFIASPRVCQILLGKSCVLPTFKNIYQVKKEFISNN
jgi:hypothetical protein